MKKHRICDTCSKKAGKTVELNLCQAIVHKLKGHRIYKTPLWEDQFPEKIKIDKSTSSHIDKGYTFSYFYRSLSPNHRYALTLALRFPMPL